MSIEICEQCILSLQQKEAFIWKHKKVEFLIAKNEKFITSMPLIPKHFRELSNDDQHTIEQFLDGFGIFSPCTIGSAFIQLYDIIKFNSDGKRYIACEKCNRLNDPNWSDCSCDE